MQSVNGAQFLNIALLLLLLLLLLFASASAAAALLVDIFSLASIYASL